MSTLFKLLYNMFFGSWMERHFWGWIYDKLFAKADKAKGWIPIVVVLALPCILFVVMLLAASGSNETDSVNAALSSLVSNNETMWQEQLHPEYAAELMNLAAFKDKLEERKIFLEGDAEFQIDFEVTKTDSDYGHGKYIETSFYCGEYKYKAKALYIDDDNGSGIVELYINLIDWPRSTPMPSPTFAPPIRTPKVE